ncbi:hypothetical protein [Actinoplanes rectilineatus]|uniref:hypothetical protein n=1 Tax=Actinoplanes rectilineatus TaxID=113571 RepID=UPI000B0406FA|nr:hypothetical protein [Actinoplanes rectilineatus]
MHPETTLAADQLHVDTFGDGPGALRVTVTGTIDRAGARRLHKAVINALRRHRPERITMDLTRASPLDPAGERCLQLCQADCLQMDCGFVQIGPDTHR